MSLMERIDREERREHEHLAMECRATRHWWQRQSYAPADWEPSPLFVGAKHVLHLSCMRCGTWRHVATDHRGYLLASRYEWPDWYLRRGDGRPTGEDLRLWQVKRVRVERRAEGR